VTPNAVCGGSCVDLQTDDANCGGCALACPTGCTQGECIQTLVPSTESVTAFAFDTSAVYFYSGANPGSIKRVSKTGGAATLVASDATTSVGALTLSADGTNVYYAASTSVRMAPLDGGASSAVTDPASSFALGEPLTAGVAMDGQSNLYWAFGNGGNNQHTIYSNHSGGAGQQPGTEYGCAAPVAQMMGASGGIIAIEGLAALGSGGGTVDVCSGDLLTGCSVTSISVPGSGGGIPGIATDGTNVYWASQSSSLAWSIYATPIASTCGAVAGSPVYSPLNWSAGQSAAGLFASDGSSLYVADPGLVKVPLAGGSNATFPSLGSGLIELIQLDPTSVFAVVGGSLVKVTPR
jgi:hypothetical protein